MTHNNIPLAKSELSTKADTIEPCIRAIHDWLIRIYQTLYGDPLDKSPRLYVYAERFRQENKKKIN